MAKSDTDVTTRTLLRRYSKHLRKQFRQDRWIIAHTGRSWSSEYKFFQRERTFHQSRVTNIAKILKERGVYLG